MNGWWRRGLCTAGSIAALTVQGPLSAGTVLAAGLRGPEVLGWSPGVTAGVAPNAALTVYFNQAMDAASLRRAWHLSPGVAGSLRTTATALTFTPSGLLRPSTQYRLTIDRSARALSGSALSGNFTAAFSTGGGLRVTNLSPAAGTTEVPSSGRIAISFNRPMVALTGLNHPAHDPPGWQISISPRLPGYGSWLGTSTWVYHPYGGLVSSTTYTVTLSRGARDAWGESLGGDTRWTFRTATPELLSRSPQNGVQAVDPHADVWLNFNQPMDPASTTRAFSLTGSGGQVQGQLTLRGGQLHFHPATPLADGATYTATEQPWARSQNGQASLGKTVRWTFRVAESPRVIDRNPEPGHKAFGSQFMYWYGPLQSACSYHAAITFSAPMDGAALDRHLSISPAVSTFNTSLNGPNRDGQTSYDIVGNFRPSTTYTVSIAAGVHDRFGRPLPGPYSMQFSTAALCPSLALYGRPGVWDGISYSSGQKIPVPLQVVNVPHIRFTLIHTTLADLNGSCCPASQPNGTTVRTWTVRLNLKKNALMNPALRLTQKDGSALSPGLYWLGVDTIGRPPGLAPQSDLPSSSEIVAVTNTGVTLKTSSSQALVWVTSSKTGKPLANTPVRLAGYQGNTIASGNTNAQGIAQFSISQNRTPTAAVVNTSSLFGLARSNWSQPATPQNGPPIQQQYYGPYGSGSYLYTDRPVYRPGQRVDFRGVLWHDQDAVYSLFGPQQVAISVNDSNGHQIVYQRATLDRFGAVHGSFVLSAAARTGYDYINVSLPNHQGTSTQFLVAEYRKPEFLATVHSQRPWYALGQQVTAQAQVNYVFGQPVRHQNVSWTAYAQSNFPVPPGWDNYIFQDWTQIWQPVPCCQPQGQFGQQIAQGSGTTDDNGRLQISFPANGKTVPNDRDITIEATATDVNHQAVSGRTQIALYRSAIAVGLNPTSWVARPGQATNISVAAVQHDGQPVAGQHVTITVVRRTYTSKLVSNGQNGTSWQAVPHDHPVSQTTLVTGPKGTVTFPFTPPRGGEYVISATARDQLGDTAYSAVSIEAGAGAVDWGSSQNTALTLHPDHTTYRVGDTAHILVPSPFANPTALITIERGTIHRSWTAQLQGSAPVIDVPITSDAIPNEYVTVTLYRGWRNGSPPDWRYGVANLAVRLDPRHIQVHLAQNGYRHHPRDPVTYVVSTTDSQGHPVSAQVSLALVDTAALALGTEQNANILQALYAQRPLGVSTQSDGVASIDHFTVHPDAQIQGLRVARNGAAPIAAPFAGGGGGGGFAPVITVRSKFADTAYWSGALVTNNQGSATVRLRLPDNATTWRLDARGITGTYAVGQAKLKTLATQDLVLRPVMPRFFSIGDHLQVGTVLNNNLNRWVTATVSMSGTNLNISGTAQRRITLRPHGEQSIVWPVGVGQASSSVVNLRAVSDTRGVAGDAVQIAIPIQPPLTDETVATSGQVFDGIRQVVILPRGAMPRPGALTVTVSSSLTAGLGAAYRIFAPVPGESNDDVASRLMAASTLQTVPATIADLLPSERRALPSDIAAAVRKLLLNQYGDGGWPWFNEPYEQSDPLITADAVDALRASGWKGPQVSEAMQRGRQYLQGQLNSLGAAERVHVMLVLARSGPVPLQQAEALYADSIRRLHLQPGPLADLAYTLALGGDWKRARSILSTLQADVQASATGAHWESGVDAYWAWAPPPISATASVLDALLKLDSHDPLVPAATRWLMLARQGSAWDCTRDSAQAIDVLTRYGRLAGEGHADYSYRVLLNGAPKLTGRMAGASQTHQGSASVPVSGLGHGLSNLDINRAAADGTLGSGPLYYVADLHYYLWAPAIAPRNAGLSISRRYLTLAGKPITSIAAGQPVKVELTLHTDQTLLYVDIEDPLPSGFDPIDESLATSQQGIYQPPWWNFSNPYSQVRDLTWLLSHTDLHDNRASLYAMSVPPGTYRYTYLARASVPGKYSVPPPHAQESFFPEVFGHGGGQSFTVR